MDPSRSRENFKAILIGGVLIVLVGAWFIFRTLHNNSPTEASTETTPNQNDGKNTTDDLPFITATAIRQKIQNGETVTFLDLRPAENFTAEHIPHALSIAAGQLSSFTPRDKEILVIILSDKDSSGKETVANILRQKSSPDFFVLEGGFEGWKVAGSQVLSIGDPDSFIDQSKITYISLADTLKAINDTENPPFLLDVQSRQDYQTKHVKGAINIPLDELEKRWKEIPASKNIIVYGGSQLTSFQGGVRLADLSFYATKTLSSPDTLKPASGLPLEP